MGYRLAGIACIVWVACAVSARGQETVSDGVRQAQACFDRGEIDDAHRLVTDAIDANGDDVAARMLRAEIGIFRFDLDEASADARAILARNAEHVGARYILARVIGRRFHDTEALAAHEALAESAPESAQAVRGLAVALAAVEREEEALAAAQRAIELDDTDGRAWVVLARIRAELDDTVGAVAAYDKAIERLPKAHRPYQGRALALAELGRLDAAREDAERALEQPIERPRALLTFAYVIGQADSVQPKAAKDAIDEAFAAEVTDPDDRLDRASWASWLGEPWRGKADLAAILETHPHSVDAHRIHARSLLARYRTHDALQAASAMLERLPGSWRAHRIRGRAHLRRRDYDAAIEALDTALEKHPRSYPLLLMRAAAKHEGKREGYDADLATAIELFPDRPDAYAQRAYYRERADDWKAALADRDRTVELRPDNTLLRAFRAVTRKRLGDSDGAAADLERVGARRTFEAGAIARHAAELAEDARHAEAERRMKDALFVSADSDLVYYAKARMADDAEDPKEALVAANRMIELRDTAANRALRSRIFGSLERLDDAVADLDRALELEPGDARTLVSRAYLHRSREDTEAVSRDFKAALAAAPGNDTIRCQRAYACGPERSDDALDELDAVLEKDPRNAFALSIRALVYMMTDESAKAMKDVERALALRPSVPDVLLRIAQVQRGADERDASIETLDDVLNRYPYSLRAREFRAYERTVDEDFEGALEDVDAALRRAPKCARFRMRRADILMRLERPDDALEELDAVIAADPKNRDARSQRGYLLAMRKAFDRALEDYDVLVKLDPKDAQSLATRAWIHVQLENWDEVIEDCDAAIEADPKLAVAYHYRGQARAALGDQVGAGEDFERYEELRQR